MVKKIVMMMAFGVLILSGCTTVANNPKSFMISPPSARNVNEELVLRGTGTKNILLLKIFTAALYLPMSVAPEQAMDTDVAKCISVTFFAKFSANDFSNFTIDHMRPNLSSEEFASLKDQLERMKALFPNIDSGDTFSIFYAPAEGTSFIHNGKKGGVIEGKIFSKAIFSTWLGSKPFDNSIKRQLLSGSYQPRR